MEGVTNKLLIFLFFIGISGSAFGQFNIQHQAPIALERGASNMLTFNVPGISESDYQQAVLYYRYDGDLSYQQREVQFQNGAFRTSISPEDNGADIFEYYLEVTLNSGNGLYYPGNLPSENPVRIEIVDDLDEEDQTPQKEQLEGVDYTILSPDPGSGASQQNVVVAIALFYDAASLEPGDFKLLLNGMDVTDEADTSAYYISYVPKNLPRGPHNIALEYETADQTYAVTDWDFTVFAAGQTSYQAFQDSNIPQGRIELTARNQMITGDVNNAYSGRTRVSGQYGDFRYSAHGYLTSQEDPRLQPQNRYGIDISYADIWDFEAGHVYPSMSPFTISGRRIHGINTSLHLLNENINMQFMYGELDRSITNQYDSLIVEDIVIGADSVVGQNFFLSYQDGGRGNFQREITGGRLSFGNEEKFQIGFHALKIQDDTTSIINVRNYNDISNSNLSLQNNLDAQDFDNLADNPDDLIIRSGNVKPRGNLIAGSDLQFGINNNRIRFESEAVVSALNNNIYDGPLSSERASDLGFDLDQSTTDLLQQLSWLIIVNENMDVLPLNISEQDGEFTAEPFFPTSILAGNSEISVRYPRNNLRVQYRWIGPNFSSLANSTIRRDIAGFTISDRLNLLSNRLYITLGYENLHDNVANTRDATTETISYRSNISWYPVNRNLPRVSAGFRYRTRDNSIERQNPFIGGDLLTASVRNVNEDSLVTPTPRHNNSINFNSSITQQFNLFNARNDISLNFNSLNTTDEVFAYGDVQSTAISLNLTSRFTGSPFETQLGYTYNDTESGSGQSQINISGFYVGGQASLLDNAFTINGRLAFTQNERETRTFDICDANGCSSEQSLNENPNDDYFQLSDESTTSNFGTYVIQAGARYDITENHALVFDANLTNITIQNTQNDRILQLRYVFSF